MPWLEPEEIEAGVIEGRFSAETARRLLEHRNECLEAARRDFAAAAGQVRAHSNRSAAQMAHDAITQAFSPDDGSDAEDDSDPDDARLRAAFGPNRPLGPALTPDEVHKSRRRGVTGPTGYVTGSYSDSDLYDLLFGDR